MKRIPPQGLTLNSQRLVMAQGTGGAIVSAVRADFFTGWVTGVGF